MKDCSPLLVPSNLGETKLFLYISERNVAVRDNLMKCTNGYEETYRNNGFHCSIYAADVRSAQQKIIQFSRKLEQESIQSDRLYFLPLFTGINYRVWMDPKRHCNCPAIRVSYSQENQRYDCKIYASDLTQLQEALFVHEKNLLKKRQQVLKQKDPEGSASQAAQEEVRR